MHAQQPFFHSGRCLAIVSLCLVVEGGRLQRVQTYKGKYVSHLMMIVFPAHLLPHTATTNNHLLDLSSLFSLFALLSSLDSLFSDFRSNHICNGHKLFDKPDLANSHLCRL